MFNLYSFVNRILLPLPCASLFPNALSTYTATFQFDCLNEILQETCTKQSQCIRHSAWCWGYSAEDRLCQGAYSLLGKQTCNSDYKSYQCCGEIGDKGLSWSRVALGGFWVNHGRGMSWPSQGEESTKGTACAKPHRYKLQVVWVWNKRTFQWNRAEGSRDVETGLPKFIS